MSGSLYQKVAEDGARRVVVGGPRVQSFGELLSFSRWARAMGEVPGGRGMTCPPAIAEETFLS